MTDRRKSHQPVPATKPAFDVQEIVNTIFDHGGNATTRELAADLGVRPSTFETWMRKHPEIKAAVREMRSYVDDAVESALAKRAKGYTVTTTKVQTGGDADITTETEVHIPPDVAAGKFWLSNRRRDKWSDRQVVEVTGNLQHILAHLDDTFDLSADDWKEIPNDE